MVNRRAFGHAPTLQQHGAGRVLPEADQFDRAGGAPGKTNAEAREIRFGEIFIGAEPHIERRRPTRERGDAALLKLIEHGSRLVGGKNIHEGAQIDRENERVAKAPDVEEWRDIENALGIERQRPQCRRGVAEGHQVAVAVIGAFGEAGGAAGKENSAKVVGQRQW